jgi:general stress protein 26
MTDDDHTLTDAEAIETIWNLAASIDVCMFITWDGKRQRARPLSARPDRETGRIHFLVDVDGAKDDQIERFPKVTMAWADVHGHDYVVITGDAIVTDDRAKIAELWTGTDRAWWDGPDDPAIRLITVAPDDAELWKSPNGPVTGARLTAAGDGASADYGENVKVDHL